MLGVLVKGDLDDGRGKARVNLFRHKHEIESGRTSSVGMEIMGFDTMGKVVTSDTPGRMFQLPLANTNGHTDILQASCLGRKSARGVQRLSPSLTWLATRSIFERQYSDCSQAVQTIVFLWWRRTTVLLA
jgi:hypothetical protein